MIDLRRVCMRMSQNPAGFEAARENNSIASTYPIQLKFEYVSELVGGDHKKNPAENLFFIVEKNNFEDVTSKILKIFDFRFPPEKNIFSTKKNKNFQK